MTKKLTKHGDNFALIIDKSILDAVGINEKTNLEIVVMGESITIKPKNTTIKANKKKADKLEESARKMMDKYESVYKKLSKT